MWCHSASVTLLFNLMLSATFPKKWNTRVVMIYFPNSLAYSHFDLLTYLLQDKTWTATVTTVQGMDASGLFTLILSYTSVSSVRVRISTMSQTAGVTLNNCSQRCYFNLSTLFGELSLTGSVTVNVTYNTFVTQFSPISVVALPQEFYKPILLRNSTGDDFLANCSVIDNDMGIGTDREEFCLAQVFSLTINYLGRALRKYISLLIFYSACEWIKRWNAGPHWD